MFYLTRFVSHSIYVCHRERLHHQPNFAASLCLIRPAASGTPLLHLPLFPIHSNGRSLQSLDPRRVLPAYTVWFNRIISAYYGSHSQTYASSNNPPRRYSCGLEKNYTNISTWLFFVIYQLTSLIIVCICFLICYDDFVQRFRADPGLVDWIGFFD